MARKAASPKRKLKKPAARKATKKRPAKKNVASAGKSGAGAAPAKGTVSIRMYRGLLGDFFLVRHQVDQQSFKMLIDCGVLQCIGDRSKKKSTALGADRIRQGVANLIKDTGNAIDLVVATHEHYDHLSGFILANDAFKNLTIGKVWMAWTEDRGDAVANGYRSKKNKALTALAALARSSAFAATDTKKTVENLLQFYGGVRAIRAGALPLAADDGKLAGNSSCEAVLEWLRQKAGPGNVSFLLPGQAIKWGIKDAFRAYVLGPPRRDDRLRKLNPSEGEKREVYLTSNEDAETVLGLAAVHGNVPDESQLASQPFALPYRRSYARNSKGSDPIIRLYENTDRTRRIDGDWQASADTLALKIDGDVNNTSLALALEVTEKRVLLFPGDAQVGNWLSWGDQTYPADDTKDGPRVKVEDLLARTVFYKVGHHASHNATLSKRGLELMTDQRLCAMIPVVKETAREQKTKNAKKGWAMPYEDLYERLKVKTNERILMGDGIPKDEIQKFKLSTTTLRYGPDEKAKDPLWVELALKL